MMLNRNFKDFKFQSQTIEEVIKMLSESGMDVQVHLHSQWINAEIKNNEILILFTKYLKKKALNFFQLHLKDKVCIN